MAAETGPEALDVGLRVAGGGQDGRLDFQDAAAGKERPDVRVESRPHMQHDTATCRHDLPGCHGRVEMHAHGDPSPCFFRRSSSQGSSWTSMPRSRALVSLEPADAPATTKSVFLETLPATLAPRAS